MLSTPPTLPIESHSGLSHAAALSLAPRSSAECLAQGPNEVVGSADDLGKYW